MKVKVDCIFWLLQWSIPSYIAIRLCKSRKRLDLKSMIDKILHTYHKQKYLSVWQYDMEMAVILIFPVHFRYKQNVVGQYEMAKNKKETSPEKKQRTRTGLRRKKNTASTSGQSVDVFLSWPFSLQWFPSLFLDKIITQVWYNYFKAYARFFSSCMHQDHQLAFVCFIFNTVTNFFSSLFVRHFRRKFSMMKTHIKHKNPLDEALLLLTSTRWINTSKFLMKNYVF